MVKALRIIFGMLLMLGLAAIMFGYSSSIFFWMLYTGKFSLADLSKISLLQTYHYYISYWQIKAVHIRLLASWIISFLIVVLPIIAGTIALIVKMFKGPSLFGDARFAKNEEVKQSGLLGHNGIIVGKYGNKYLCFDGQQFVLLYAPTRSGKGVGVVVPNLLNWPDSVVVLDVKPELWRITSGFRKKHGQKCFQLSPLSYKTHRWNPLAYISDDPNQRISDIQQIANMLVPDKPGVDPIWTATPRKLFLGVVLYLLETPDLPTTLGEVLRQLSTPQETASYFAEIVSEREETEKPLSFQCKQALLGFIGIESEKTRSGVKESLTSTLELWLNPIIDAATSGNDFDLREVRRKRMSIYICLQPNQLEMLAPLVNLFFQQLINLNTQEHPDDHPDLKYKCLLVLDEFPAIGKVSILAKSIAFIAGFNLRLLTICQSPSQIRGLYGNDEAENFFDNHALEIIFATKNTKIRREISEKLGDTTIDGKSVSRPTLFGGKQGASESISDQRRPLLLPQEITELGFKNQIVILEGTKPIRTKKILYFKDKVFTSRLLPASDVPKIEVNSIERDLDFSQLKKTDANEPGKPDFVEVTQENINLLDINSMDLNDLDLKIDAAALPETLASEEEVDELVSLFLSEVS